MLQDGVGLLSLEQHCYFGSFSLERTRYSLYWDFLGSAPSQEKKPPKTSIHNPWPFSQNRQVNLMKPDLAASERDPKSKHFFPAEPYAALKAGNP